RIAVLNKGVLQQVDTPEMIYDHPVNRFVAGFIGSPTMNFLDCTLAGDGDSRLVADGWTLGIPPAAGEAIKRSGRDITVLGIRPEDIAMRLQAAAGDLPGTIYAVEPLGDRTIYDVTLGRQVVRIKSPPNVMLEPGTPVFLGLDRDRIH